MPRSADRDPVLLYRTCVRRLIGLPRIRNGPKQRASPGPMTALNSRIAALVTRTVVSRLRGDEMVAIGSAESAQAALDKTEPTLTARTRGRSWSR